MYNPSRGGVRGGADQFTWESVKTDKHRENYLGHSLRAPVGRWQKGKDLSWYAKERKDDEDSLITERSELAAIKRAEEEAMLIALGQKVVKKESQALSKEEMAEVLKRNIGYRDKLNIERVDGVGTTSGRAALLTGVNKDSRSKKEGVLFETQRERSSIVEDYRESSPSYKRSKKRSKKHKKEKKTKRSHPADDSNDSETESTSRRKHKKHKKEYDSSENVSKTKHKKTKHRHQSLSSSGSDSHRRVKSKTHEKHRTQKRDSFSPKRRRHDTSESD